jgi:hypothetical protein
VVFSLGRVWTTVGLLNESEINCTLIKGDRSADKARNSTDVCIGVLVWLAGLIIHVEGLVDSKGQ